MDEKGYSFQNELLPPDFEDVKYQLEKSDAFHKYLGTRQFFK